MGFFMLCMPTQSNWYIECNTAMSNMYMYARISLTYWLYNYIIPQDSNYYLRCSCAKGDNLLYPNNVNILHYDLAACFI